MWRHFLALCICCLLVVFATHGHCEMDVTVTWNSVEAADLYYVYHSNVSGEYDDNDVVYAGRETQWTFHDLSGHQPHYFVVTAANYYGESGPSNELAVLQADFDDDGVVSFVDVLILAFSWEKQPGEVGYNSRCDLNGDGQIRGADLWIFCYFYYLSPMGTGHL